jgi:invasion protein IalB
MDQRHSRIRRLAPGAVRTTKKLVLIFAACAALNVAAATTVLAQAALIFSPWVKLCNKDTGYDAQGICVTVADGRDRAGNLVVSIGIFEAHGEQRQVLRLRMPYGVNLHQGTRLIVDQGQPANAPFVTCLPPEVPPGGCVADYDATPDVITQMKNGKVLTVQAIYIHSQAMSPQIELSGFAEAFDGPPTAPKAFEEQWKKLQEKRIRDEVLQQQKRIRDDSLQPHLIPKNY